MLHDNSKHVKIYTDGACSGNPGPGGWCAILQWNGRERIVQGGVPDTTNNRMELTAIIEGLVALKEPCKVTVFTDSQYAIGLMAMGWKRKANRDLLHELDALCVVHEVEFQHVRGHDGHPQNERCDRIACQERDRARRKAKSRCQESRWRDFSFTDEYDLTDGPVPSGYEQLPDQIADMLP